MRGSIENRNAVLYRIVWIIIHDFMCRIKSIRKKREALVDKYSKFLLVNSWCYQSHKNALQTQQINFKIL